MVRAVYTFLRSWSRGWSVNLLASRLLVKGILFCVRGLGDLLREVEPLDHLAYNVGLHGFCLYLSLYVFLTPAL